VGNGRSRPSDSTAERVSTGPPRIGTRDARASACLRSVVGRV
jgi:hypothetical protein